MRTHTYNEQLKVLGISVRDLRSARGFSQESFADACGLDRSYVGGVERGERNLGFKNLLRISQALDLEPSELLANISVKSMGR